MPITNSRMVHRENLACFMEGLSGERIIYVCAPAGYGKTVAVREWLARRGYHNQFVSLDEYDNDPVNFCQRFCAALHGCQPKNSALQKITSHPAFDSAPEEFTVRGIAALSGAGRACLVIDDLHFIRDERVLRLLPRLLKRLPDSFQIVLVSRNELPPYFSELWLKGNLARVTADDLRFNRDEIMLLYKERGYPITPEKADEALRFTHGWAIGIIALLLSGGDPSGESLGYLEEFIRSNIWEKWDEATREFMLKTAAARELIPSLCDELAEVGDSEKLLKNLIRSGAFIYQTGDGVYHYHHLFHAFLKGMLRERGDEYLFSLLDKEGEWHLSRYDFYSAADCFIRCHNHDGIAKCFDILEVTDRNDFVIDRMLPVIKNPEISAATDKYPFLLYLMAWAAYIEGRTEDMVLYMDRYYARYPEIAARDPAHAHNIFYMRIFDFRISLTRLIGDMAALPAVPEIKGVQGSATLNMPLLHRSIYDFSEMAAGDTEENISKMGDSIGWLFGEEWSLLMESITACLLYEQGQLEKAQVHALAANAGIKNHFAPESKFCAMAALVCISDALGQPDESKNAMERIASMIERDRAYYLNRNFRAFAARRELGKGSIEAAAAWIMEHGEALNGNLNLHGIYETFTTCRAYIAKGDYDSAAILLKKVLALAEAYNRPLDIIEANLLLSIACWKKKRGFQNEAMRYLENAVSLAYAYGYTQIFINDGVELAGMLRRLQKKAEQPGKDAAAPASFIKVLYLNAVEHQESGLTSGQPERREKYTDKQKTVMKLLCEGKSYREIAGIMEIKRTTLRSHIALIYKKLEVTCEADAILKIKTMGILNAE